MKIADTHCDTLCALKDKRASFFSDELDFSPVKLTNNHHIQFFACFISPEYYSSAKLRCIDLINTFEKKVKPYCKKNLTAYLSIEGGECIEQLQDVEYYFSRGVKMIAPVWNNKNKIASGISDYGGVTEYGKQVISEMNRLGILLDVSHMNEESFFDTINLTTLPPVASHSCSKSLCNHPRNLTDEQFLVIKNLDGYVGINFYPKFLTDKDYATSCDIIDHIEHFLSLGGEDCIGLGSDFDGIDVCPINLPDVRHIDTLITEMQRRGWSDCLVRKIMGENICNITRFF